METKKLIGYLCIIIPFAFAFGSLNYLIYSIIGLEKLIFNYLIISSIIGLPILGLHLLGK